MFEFAIVRPIIACVPVDTTELVKLGPEVADIIPKPSIVHTLQKCQGCGQDVWIGPEQLKVANASAGKVLCYPCVFKEPGVRAADIFSLNPNADDIPRRT